MLIHLDGSLTDWANRFVAVPPFTPSFSRSMDCVLGGGSDQGLGHHCSGISPGNHPSCKWYSWYNQYAKGITKEQAIYSQWLKKLADNLRFSKVPEVTPQIFNIDSKNCQKKTQTFSRHHHFGAFLAVTSEMLQRCCWSEIITVDLIIRSQVAIFHNRNNQVIQ